MFVDENEFFRQAVFHICRNLDFEFALQECLLYLRSFMPADMFHLTIYDRGLKALKTIAMATPTEAKRVNIIIPLDDEGKNKLSERLGVIVDKKVVIRSEVDTSLIGGIIARVGGKLIDGSTSGKLKALKRELGGAIR